MPAHQGRLQALQHRFICGSQQTAVPIVDRASSMAFASRVAKSGAKWSTLYVEIPPRKATGNSISAPVPRARIEHDAGGKATGRVYFDRTARSSGRRRAPCASPANSIETPRLLLPVPVEQVSRWARQFFGTVWQELPAAYDGLRLRHLQRAGAHVARHEMPAIITDEDRHDPKRGFAGGYEMETLSLGLPFMAAFLNPGAWAANSPTRWTTMSTWPACGSSARICRRSRIALRCMRARRTSSPGRPNVHYRRPSNDIAMRDHAYKQGKAIYEAVGPRRPTRSRRIHPRTISAPAA